MLPVTGPFNEVVTSDPVYYSNQDRWKQVPPYNLALRYFLSQARRTYRDPTFPVGTYPASLCKLTSHPSTALNQCKILAYDKLKANTHDQASLGAGLAEARQSIGMINARALQLLSFVRALKKLRFGEAASILSVPVPSKVGPSKKVSSNFLEFHFGWSPLVGDIYSALDVLGGSLKAPKVFGKAGPIKTVQVTGNWPSPPPLNSYGTQVTYETYVRYGMEVSISNPNVALFNQLGLINPATVVWEVIPFSFVLDWFVNVEQFLSSATDFLGLSVQNSYTTGLTRAVRVDVHNSGLPNLVTKQITSLVIMTRDQGISQPSLGIRPFKVWGWRRAASAVALLTLQLKSIR